MRFCLYQDNREVRLLFIREECHEKKDTVRALVIQHGEGKEIPLPLGKVMSQEHTEEVGMPKMISGMSREESRQNQKYQTHGEKEGTENVKGMLGVVTTEGSHAIQGRG